MAKARSRSEAARSLADAVWRAADDDQSSSIAALRTRLRECALASDLRSAHAIVAGARPPSPARGARHVPPSPQPYHRVAQCRAAAAAERPQVAQGVAQVLLDVVRADEFQSPLADLALEAACVILVRSIDDVAATAGAAAQIMAAACPSSPAGVAPTARGALRALGAVRALRGGTWAETLLCSLLQLLAQRDPSIWARVFASVPPSAAAHAWLSCSAVAAVQAMLHGQASCSRSHDDSSTHFHAVQVLADAAPAKARLHPAHLLAGTLAHGGSPPGVHTPTQHSPPQTKQATSCPTLLSPLRSRPPRWLPRRPTTSTSRSPSPSALPTLGVTWSPRTPQTHAATRWPSCDPRLPRQPAQSQLFCSRRCALRPPTPKRSAARHWLTAHPKPWSLPCG